MPRHISRDSTLSTLRQEAKDWLRSLRAGDAEAHDRFERVMRHKAEDARLHDVQLALARSLGFAGWTALKEHATREHRDITPADVVSRYQRIADNLLDAYRMGTAEAMERHWNDTWHRRSWQAMRRYVQLDLGIHAESHEGSIAAPADAGPDITMEDARWLVAREHGFEDWSALIARAPAMVPRDGGLLRREIGYVKEDVTRMARGRANRARTWHELLDALEDEDASALEAHGEMTDEMLARIAEYPHITSLALGGSSITGAGLRQLARMPHLRWLDLNGCPLLDDDALGALQDLVHLEKLNLSGTAITDTGAKALAGCQNLRWIALDGTRTGDGAIRALNGMTQLHRVSTGMLLTDNGLPALQEIPQFRRRSVDIGGVEMEITSFEDESTALHLHGAVTDAGLRNLRELNGLQTLNLDDAALRISAEGVASLDHLPGLVRLHVDATDDIMAAVATLPALRFLLAQDTAAGDDGFVALSRSRTLEYIWGRRCHNLRGRGFEALSRMPSLRALSVSCLNVPDASLASLPSFPSLREIMPMDVPDEGYRHIAECSKLDRLILMYCRETTDAATEHIARLPHLRKYFASYTRATDRTLELLATMTSLESIDLSGVAQMTDTGIGKLKRLPNLRYLSVDGMPGVSRAALDGFGPGVQTRYDL